MSAARKSLSRRSFLKRAGGAAGIFTAGVLDTPRLAAAVDASAGDVSATASDMVAAERFTILKWSGPTDAVVQLRQLQLFGNWTQWVTVTQWSDVVDEGTPLPTSGLIRTNGAQALQARAISSGVNDLSIVRVAAAKSSGPIGS